MSPINRKHNQPDSQPQLPEVHHYNKEKFQPENTSPLLQWKEMNSPSYANLEDFPDFTGLVWTIEAKTDCT